MESFECNGDSRLLVMDLSLIKQLAAQLEVHLGESPDLCNCKSLTSQISSLTEHTIAVVTSPDFDGDRKRSAGDAGLASPVTLKSSKKRKLEKMKNQVRVSSAGGGETPVDDGHSWRKYGQKEILGAKYPRSYYRCTHRHSQECLAIKQVQRTDEGPGLFDVFYIGTHTCTAATPPPPEHKHNPDAHGALYSLTASLAVKTEGLAAAEEPHGCWSAAATTTPASVCLPPERSPFSPMSVSPATSDSNHVASLLAPFDAAAEWRANSELQEVVSALEAASTPPPPPPSADDFTDDLLDFDIASFFA